MADEFDDDLDDLDFDLEENEDVDGEIEGSGDSIAASSSSGSKTDIYTAMLIISAAFYLIALVATMAEMAPYCTDFLGGLF